MTCPGTHVSVNEGGVRIYMQSLLFDHILEVSLTRNPVKNRTQRESVVLAKRGGGTNSRYVVFGGSGCGVYGLAFSAFDSTWNLDV